MNKWKWKPLFCSTKDASMIKAVNTNRSQVPDSEPLPSSLWGQVYGPSGPPQSETPHLPIPPKTPPRPPAPQRTLMWFCSSSWCRPQTSGPRARPSPSPRLPQGQERLDYHVKNIWQIRWTHSTELGGSHQWKWCLEIVLEYVELKEDPKNHLLKMFLYHQLTVWGCRSSKSPKGFYIFFHTVFQLILRRVTVFKKKKKQIPTCKLIIFLFQRRFQFLHVDHELWKITRICIELEISSLKVQSYR